MKTYIKHLTLILATSLFFAACKKNDDVVRSVSLEFAVSIDSEDNAEKNMSTDGTLISITSKINGQVYRETVQNGKVVFGEITPGAYTVNASLNLTPDQYKTRTNVTIDGDISFNQALEILVIENQQSSIELIPSRSTGNGDQWVIKQWYYAGSHTTQGASFRDVFIEIYNNSFKTLYADSLYFGLGYGKNNVTPGDFLLANLQFDWAQALNMTSTANGTNSNNDFVYLRAMFMIPSDDSGTKYPVAPGQSILVAATALNHTEPYQTNTGVVQGVTNPALTIDLSHAEFEVNMLKYETEVEGGRTPYRWDLDTDAENVEVIFKEGMRDLLFDVAQGRDGIVLFSVKGTNEDPREWPRYANPQTREIVAATVLYPQVPTKFILDGVEIQNPITTNSVPKRFPISIDAGRTFVPGGGYSGQSLVRKTKEITPTGRRILQKTNNSEVDFGFLPKADPSKKASSFLD